MLYGKTTYGRLSRFAADIPPLILEMAGAKTVRKPAKNIIFEETPGKKTLSSMFSQEQKIRPSESYSVGEMVEHQTFGRGMVISAKIMANDIFLEVAFDRVGTKKLMANFAKLKKIQ
ncbi:hypothetical protein SDC9_106260 [bioreactor metagenome]|uniref:Uncharacterized protein n=1 Tax=bioreactor metagenome TaxID=1076179 RepID=A0A645B2W3_9ZZZZ